MDAVNGSVDPRGVRRCAYNLFRRAGSSLVCAVPLDRPVPGFVGGGWVFLGDLEDVRLAPRVGWSAVARGASRRGWSLFRAERIRE